MDIVRGNLEVSSPAISLSGVDSKENYLPLPTSTYSVVQRHSFTSLWLELVKSLPSCIPVFNILWIFLICPILAFLHLAKQEELLKGQWGSYVGRLNLSSYPDFLEALGRFTKLLPQGGSSLREFAKKYLEQN